VPGFVLNCSGEIEALMDSTGLPLGMFEDCRVETKSIRLTAGRIVVLLTDGVSEASDPAGEQLGLQGIAEYVRAHRTEPAQNLADGLCQHARAFTGAQAQQDDTAAVILKTG